MKVIGRVVAGLAVLFAVLPTTLAVSQPESATAVAPPDAICSAGETPNVSGSVTASGSGYATTVELYAVGPDGGSSAITNFFDTVWLGYSESNSSGQFGFCVDQAVQESMSQWGFAGLAAVASPRTSDPQNTLGLTTSSVNSVTCIVLGNCDFSIAMSTAVIAGVVSHGSSPVSSVRVSVMSASEPYVEVAGVVTDSQGRFAIGGTLPNGTYSLHVDPIGATKGIVPFEGSLQASAGVVTLGPGLDGTPTNIAISMSTSLLTGRITTPNGTPILQSDGHIEVYIIKLDPTNCPLQDVSRLYQNGCFRSVYISADGHYTASVEPGNWFVAANGPNFFGGFGAANVQANGTLTEISLAPQLQTTDTVRAADGRSYLDVALTAGNFSGRVAHPTSGAAIAGSAIYVSKVDSNGYYFDQPKMRANGEFIWKADPSFSTSVYRFEVQADDSALTVDSVWNTLAPRTHYVKVAFASGTASVQNTCTVSYQQSGPVPTCTGAPEALVASQYPFKPYLANIKFTVCAPGVAPACELIQSQGGQSRTELGRFNSQSNQFEWVNGGSQVVSTTVQEYVAAPDSGSASYQITVVPPYDYASPIVADPVWFSIDSTGVVTKCSQKPTSNSCPTGTGTALTPSQGVYDVGSTRFRTPRFVVTVRDPNGDAVEDSWVGAFSIDDNSQMWLGGAQTTSSGQVGLDSLITQAGTVRLQASPPFDPTGGSSRLSQGSIDVTVTGSAGSLAMSPANPVITLKRPNVEGRVLAGSNPVPWTHVEVEEWNEDHQHFRYSNQGTNTDRNGEYFLNLSVGRWRIEGWAPSTSNDYTSGYTEVVVAENGTVTTVNDVPYTSGPINVSLRSPNLVGKVMIPGGTPTPAPNVGVQFEKYSEISGNFEWVEKWTNTNSSGQFANLLESGRYKVTARPNPNNTQVAPGSSFIKVVVNGQSSVVTSCSSSTDTVCSGVLPSDGLVITFETPNVKGHVVAGGQASRGGVNVEKWDTNRFEWINTYAESDPTNGFAMRLNDGVYRFNVEPWGLPGYSRGSRVIRIAGSTWCEQSFDESTMSLGTPCSPSNSFTPGTFLLTLPSANVKVDLKFNGQPVSGQMWVSVARISSSGGMMWSNLGSQVQGGQFWVSLPVEASTHYKLMVNAPNPNPNNLTKKSFELWVGDYVTGGPTNDVCLTEPVSNVCDAPITAGTAFDITMSAGNIQGTVFNPSSSPVGQVGINVMQRVNNNWNWVDIWAEASSASSTLGRFSLDLKPDSGTATYQVTARPWGGSFSPGKTTIQVNSTGNWCVIETGSSCTIPSQMPQGANLSIDLANPNVTGRVLGTSQELLRDAWVEVLKLVPAEGTQGQAGYRPAYWRHVEGLGDNTDSNGSFQLFIDEAGDYKVSINPPWNSTGLARFSDEFTVVASGNSFVAQGLGNNGDLQFPSPNITATVKKPGASTEVVADAWVNLVKIENAGTQNEWQRWLDAGGNTTRQGQLNLNYVEAGTYKLVVNPPWNSTGLARFTTGSFTIDQNGVATGLPAVLRFPQPNVTGMVNYKNDPSDVSSIAVSNGWIGVYDTANSRWVDGVGIRQQGTYEMYLPDGGYELTFYPNVEGKEFAPVTKTVTVSGGVMTGGSLSGAGNSTVTFGALPPTIEVTVTMGGVAQGGAAVRLTNGSTSYTFQTDSNGKVRAYVPDGTYSVRAGKVVVVGSSDVVRSGTGSIVSSASAGLSSTTITIS